jgi:hypothetical protein
MTKTAVARSRTRGVLLGTSAVASAAVIVIAVAWHAMGGTTTTTSTTTGAPSGHITTSAPTSLTAPTTSAVSDALFLSDVTRVDPALVAYEKRSGNTALRSLLTDGSAFCAFLLRDRDIDTAMVSVAVGARQVEATSHLPLTVTTFNAIDSVALLTLCPSLDSLVPTSDLTKIHELSTALAVPTR